jgi:glycosyltransferase involved in cell wall biosynthesis
MTRLAVGMNLLFLGERAAGAGRYVRELMPALLQVDPNLRLVAFVSRGFPCDLLEQPWADSVEWVRVPVEVGGRRQLLAQFTAIPALAAAKRLDVVHSPANVGPLVMPGVAGVVTLHDLIWLHHGELWGSARAVDTTKRLSLYSARRARRVIAISEAAGEDFVTTLGLDRARVDVVPHGVRAYDGPEPPAEQEVRGRLELGDRPIVLCVAQKRRYKNQEALVRALADLPPGAATLALVGPGTPHEPELRRLADELGVAASVRFLDWVSEPDLEALYRAAACFVLPSLIEGFGLPVLEAMVRGVPVACSNRWSLPEVAGDAALLFDPEDQAAVTAAVRRLLEEPSVARKLAEKGRERARSFTWERTAEATLRSYRAAAGRGPAGEQ